MDVVFAFLAATTATAVLSWLARGARERHHRLSLEFRLAAASRERDDAYLSLQHAVGKLDRAERDLHAAVEQRDGYALQAAVVEMRLRTHRREAADGLEALARLDIDPAVCPAREWVDRPGEGS